MNDRGTAAYDYTLPPDRIARYPAAERDGSRLLHLDRSGDLLTDRTFDRLVDLIPEGDALVLNDSRVFPARLIGEKPTGAPGEVLLVHPRPDAGPGEWDALVRPGGKLKPGRTLVVAPELRVEILDSVAEGMRRVRLDTPLDPAEAIERFGVTPLPPYLDRQAETIDRDRYQTVYAAARGSVAAPTAGLHFTEALLDRLVQRGVRLVYVTLHVGVGTFRPVESDDPGAHVMHHERYRLSDEAVKALNEVRGAGGKVWAVGTTVVRVLESVWACHGRLEPGAGSTDLFIREPFDFRVVDRLITNFHLPRSTLLMLVAAFAGYERTMAAYRHAVAEGYRFYSYGDAMVIE